MKRIQHAGYPGPTAIEAMNWNDKKISVEEFLQKAFDRAKRAE